MSIPALKRTFSLEEYYLIEEQANYKSEFYDGEIFAMAGGRPNHSFISSNITSALSNKLQNKNCRVFNSDLKIQILKNITVYPDAGVVCGKIELAENRKDAITNPILVVEVSSPSTKEYDRSGKFMRYQQIESLETYLLVDSEKFFVEVFSLQKNGKWTIESFENLNDKISLESLNIELKLSDIYEKIEF